MAQEGSKGQQRAEEQELQRGGQGEQGLERRRGGGLGMRQPGMLTRRLFDDFDRMFEMMERQFFGPRFFDRPFGGLFRVAGDREVDWVPRVEVRDTGREILVLAELPGVDPKNVKIECTEDALTLEGESREEGEDEGVRFLSYGRFYREIPLPPGLQVDKAEASFRNGLLRIRIPRAETEQRRRQITIQAGGEEDKARSEQERQAGGEKQAA